MTRLKFGLIVAFILSVAFLAGCSGAGSSNANTSGNAANEAQAGSQRKGNDNLEELQALVPITFEPEEVVWRTSESGGKQRLVAVLVLTSDDHRKLAGKYGGTPTDVQVNVEQWFPVELVTMGESSGENTFAGKAFPAAEFYQSPFTSGSIVFVPETNYIILDLQSG